VAIAVADGLPPTNSRNYVSPASSTRAIDRPKTRSRGPPLISNCYRKPSTGWN